MKTLFLLAASASILAAPALAGQAAPAADKAADKAAPAAAVGTTNLVAVAKSDSQFSTLAKAIEAAGLADTLAEAGPYTLFAPTDAAFAKLPAGELDRLLQPANREQLKTLLMNHVVEGQAKADYFTGKNGELTALGGGKLALDGAAGVKIGGATVVKPDIMASNGVIHAVDTVILPAAPQQAATAAQAPTQTAAVKQ
jgi:uncharacterized surface protein with fasciclin (FAS1) repeats